MSGVIAPGGAGRGGGLLFLALVLLVAYLVVTAVGGLLRLALAVAVLPVVVLLARDVARRR